MGCSALCRYGELVKIGFETSDRRIGKSKNVEILECEVDVENAKVAAGFHQREVQRLHCRGINGRNPFCQMRYEPLDDINSTSVVGFGIGHPWAHLDTRR